MKRILIVSFVGILFFASCTNNGSSTVGTYEQEQEETSHSTEQKAHGASEGHENAESSEHAHGEGSFSDTTSILNDTLR